MGLGRTMERTTVVASFASASFYVRRCPSSARRGRRLASADFRAWVVGFGGGGGFALLFRGPTHHSTEPAKKTAQSGEFKRWSS